MTRFLLVAFSVLVNARPVGLRIVASPFVLLGLFACGASVGVWLLVLSRVEAGYAYPMLSVGYIVNAVAGYYPFQENLSVTRVAGILVIVLGVYLVSRSYSTLDGGAVDDALGAPKPGARSREPNARHPAGRFALPPGGTIIASFAP